MWSPVEKTALAEAEIEYHDHKSHTIWVAFKIKNASAEISKARIVFGPRHRGPFHQIAQSPSIPKFLMVYITLMKHQRKVGPQE